jgi:hypothetical protein
VVELEAIKLILQLSDLQAVCSHLGLEVAQLFHDLVDDKPRVALNIESSNAQLNGDTQAIDECLTLCHII